jgi:hypothetical protein
VEKEKNTDEENHSEDGDLDRELVRLQRLSRRRLMATLFVPLHDKEDEDAYHHESVQAVDTRVKSCVTRIVTRGRKSVCEHCTAAGEIHNLFVFGRFRFYVHETLDEEEQDHRISEEDLRDRR